MLSQCHAVSIKAIEHSYLEDYIHYLGETSKQIDHKGLIQLLLKGNVDLYNPELPRSPTSTIVVTIGDVNRRAALITYVVRLGILSMKIKMLNAPGRVVRNNRRLIHSNWPTIVLLCSSSKRVEFVCKRKYFLQVTHLLRKDKDGLQWTLPCSYSEIEGMVIECAMARLFSLLRVGVNVGCPDHDFDLVCYEDCIEFFMEKCETVQFPSKREIEALERRLKYCLAVMHHFGYIHKDVKPSNILINSKKEYVLADFEISTYVFEKPGEKSLTYKEGTHRYMSPEMQQIGSQYGLVDLYWNDIWGLKKAIEYFQNKIPRRQQQATKRSPPTFVEQEELIMQFSALVFKSQRPSELLLQSCFNYYLLDSNQAKTQFDMNFLTRSLGQSNILVQVLEIASNLTQREVKLFSKLKRRLGFSKGFLILGQQELLRRGYLRAIQRIERKAHDDRTEQFVLAWQIARKIVESLNDRQEAEESEEILKRISAYIPKDEFPEYQILLLETKILNDTLAIGELEAFIDAGISNHGLLKLLFSSFVQKKYSLCFYILEKLSYHKDVYLEDQSPQSIVKHLHQEASVDLKKQITKFISTNAEMFGSRFQLQSMSGFEDRNCLLRKMSYETSNAQTNWSLGCYRQTANWYGKAYSTARTLYTEQNTYSLWIAVQRSKALLHIGRSEQIRAIIKKIMDHETNLLHVYPILLSEAYIMLISLQLRDGRTQKCIDLIERAIELDKQLYYDHTLKNTTIPRLIRNFLKMGYPNPHQTRILKIIASIEKTIQSQEWARTQHFWKRFEVSLCLDTIYSRLGIETTFGDVEAIRQRVTARNSFPILIDLQNYLTTNGLRLQHKHALRVATLFDSILTQFPLTQEPLKMFRLCEGILCIEKAGKRDITEKWVKYIVEMSESQKTIIHPEVQEIAAVRLFNACYWKEADALAKPLIHRNGIATYISAECKMFLNLSEESIELYRRFIDHNVLCEEDAAFGMQICLSHYRLSILYNKTEKHQLSQLQARLALECCRSYRPPDIKQELILMEMVGQLSRQNSKTRQIVQCRQRLSKLVVNDLANPLTAIKTAFELREYKLVHYLSRKLFNREDELEKQLIVIKHALILRKLKGFYRSARMLISISHDRPIEILHNLLKSRRQYIKLYVLFQERTPGYLTLETTLNIIDKGLDQHVYHWPSQKRIKILVFMKKLFKQCVYSKHSNFDKEPRIRATVNLMKSLF